MMRKSVWFSLILTLLLLAGCKSGDKGPQGLILYQALDEDGVPGQKLVVADVTGKELRRISLSASIRQGFPTHASHQALVYTDDDKSYLVDAKQGTVQELADGVYHFAHQFRFSGGGERWMLMGNPRGDLTYLVNLETGQVRDMTTLDESVPFIFYGLFAPDKEHLILGLGSDLWLVPTDNPVAARRLGTGRTTFASSFSSDGKQVAYVQRNEHGADEFEVVLERVDGSQSEVVASADFIDAVAFVPDRKQLILVTAKEETWKTSLLSLDNGKEQELLTLSGRPQRLLFAPSEKKLLLGDMTGETTVWHLIDLKGGTAQSLDDLQGYVPYFWDREHRWLIFLDSFELGGGRRFLSLDLESGETKHVAAFDEETLFRGVAGISRDGKFGLVNAQTADKSWQLWLIRADGGEPRLLAESSGVASGAFAPDGHWVAVSTMERVDDGNLAELTLMEIDGEETRALGEGVRPIWVRP